MNPLPFTYNFDNSTSVQKQTDEFLENNEEFAGQLFELSWAFHSIGNAIPHTTESWWSGHYFPFSESFEEFEISFLLCSQGFYKQSMTSLRSVLETGLLSVYYNINDEGHKTVQVWLQSEDGKQNDTPYFNTIWKILIAHPNILKFQNTYDLKAEILNLGYLHNYVHSKGAKYSNQIGLFKSNTQTFERTGFTNWLETAQKVVRVILILHLLKYPLAIIEYDFSRKFGIDIPTFGGLNSFHISRIKSVLGANLSEILLNIALEDNSVIDFIKQIESMPDITQAEIDKQIETINRMTDGRKHYS
jgi:hypothetical protein